MERANNYSTYYDNIIRSQKIRRVRGGGFYKRLCSVRKHDTLAAVYSDRGVVDRSIATLLIVKLSNFVVEINHEL